MNKLIALIVLIAGLALIYMGTQRKNSLVGASESVGKEIASKVDGDAHVTTHTMYIVGGVVVAIIGTGMLFPPPLGLKLPFSGARIYALASAGEPAGSVK